MKPVRLSRQASQDIDQISRYIAQERPLAAVAFVDDILDHCRRIALAPEGFAFRPAYGPAVRGVVVAPYLVLYRIRPDRIVVLTVRHGARRPVKLK